MLKFIGCGSAFAINSSNNSAFFIKNKTLNLFDCGETVFENIVRKNILKGIEKVNIFITHLHSDHCGSLGSFIFYLSAIGISTDNIRVIFPNKKKISSLLNIFGVINECKLINKYDDFKDFEIKSFRQKHYDMISYGYLCSINGQTFYFSGDTCELNAKILNLLLQDKIDKLYIDTDVLNRGGKYHLEFNTLKKYIPKNLRSHVVCMHLHDNCNKQKIKKEGFDLPELI